MNKVSKISLATWLIADDQDELLEDAIDNLALSQDAPKFDPHITMSFLQIPLDRIGEAKKRLEVIALDFTPITLSVKGVEYADNFFQAIFLRFEDSAELTDLYNRIESSLAEFGDYMPNPHLSILYKEMPSEEKEKIIPTIKLPSRVTFSKLGLNILTDDSKLQDVENWRIEVL